MIACTWSGPRSSVRACGCSPNDGLHGHRACLEDVMRIGENHPSRSLVATLVAISAFAALVLTPAAAQIAGRTITIVVPYSPGTGIDILARAIGAELSQHWGQP